MSKYKLIYVCINTTTYETFASTAIEYVAKHIGMNAKTLWRRIKANKPIPNFIIHHIPLVHIKR